MAVSDYLQKSSSTCSYSYSKLKDVLYLVSAAHVKDITIDKDNDEAHIEELDELPLRINGFNIQFKEESSLDERYKFQKTLTLSMHGYVNYKLFDEKYYAIIEDVEGTFWMVNVDFPSRITHTFNLSKDTNQTDFTFSSLSNFPTLKLDNDFEAVEPVCLGLNVYGIEKLQLIEKEKATLDTREKTVISTEPFKTIDFLGDSCSFQEVYDGTKVTDTITFNIAFNNYKPSWQYKLLEFLENRYSAIITPKSHDNEYYPGYNFGLQPSYTIQTASNPGESDIITVTLVETSFYGATADVDWKDEQSTETRWRWVKNVNGTICWECIGYNTARYLVKQQVDYFGNPTGNYQVMEGYESQYSSFNIVDTFTEEVTFANASCGGGNCNITTNIPSIIQFNSATCNTYTLQTSCDWSFINIPSNITITPSSGNANTNYTVSICNTATPSSTPIENTVTLKCCAVNRTINLKVFEDNNCVRPSMAVINCLGQDVTFTYEGSCLLSIASIDSRLTYTIGNNRITVKVPRNYSTSAITWSINAVNCNCSSSSTTFSIRQDKTYERWVQEDGYTCESGNSYHIERRYTGTTQDNITVRTDETRKGSLITSGDTRCGSSQTKWEWDNESYYCVNGNKVKAIFEWISYDNGTNWLKTGNTRLGDIVESASTWCASAVTYSWVLTDKYECEGMPSGTKFQATYSGGKTYSAACDSSTELTSGETRPVGYEYSAMTSAVIGDCVTSIGNHVLSIYPDSFSSIIITVPDSVTTIGNGVFCSGEKGIERGADIEVYIGSGVTSIGTHFLQNNPGWHEVGSTKLTITATTPPTLGQYAMYPNEMSTIDIFVPASSVLAYKSASGWSEFADRIQAIS